MGTPLLISFLNSLNSGHSKRCPGEQRDGRQPQGPHPPCRGQLEGAAILFHSAKWTLMRERKTDRGIWARLRRFESIEVWARSLYIPPTFTHAQHAEAVRQHLENLPPTSHYPSCLLRCDLNQPCGGLAELGMKLTPKEMVESKPGMCSEKGLMILPPRSSDRALPATRPRNGTHGRQIDMFVAKKVQHATASIHPGSGEELATDHDALIFSFRTKAPPVWRRRVNTKPRQVVAPFEVGTHITQENLELMARKRTKSGTGTPPPSKWLSRKRDALIQFKHGKMPTGSARLPDRSGWMASFFGQLRETGKPSRPSDPIRIPFKSTLSKSSSPISHPWIQEKIGLNVSLASRWMNSNRRFRTVGRERASLEDQFSHEMLVATGSPS